MMERSLRVAFSLMVVLVLSEAPPARGNSEGICAGFVLRLPGGIPDPSHRRRRRG